jgi:hypothetical protein
MGIATDLALITIDPSTGKSLVGLTENDPVFGGAVLLELVLAERVAIEPDAKARVRVVNDTSMADDVLDRALGRIKPGSRQKAAALVPRLGKGSRALLIDQLITQHAVRPRRVRVWGIFPVTRHDVADADRHARLRRAVTDVLLGASEPDATTGPLVSLLLAGNVVKQLVDKPDRKAAVRRAKTVAEGEWAGAAAQAAINAANTAVMAAVTAAITSSYATSSGS